MARLDISIDVPSDLERFDLEVLKKQLSAFARFLLTSPSITQPKSNETDQDPFASLDTDWGGNRDANDIADELHEMRTNTRTIEAW